MYNQHLELDTSSSHFTLVRVSVALSGEKFTNTHQESHKTSVTPKCFLLSRLAAAAEEIVSVVDNTLVQCEQELERLADFAPALGG